MHRNQLLLWWISYFNAVVFMSISYIPHLVMRLTYIFVLGFMILRRASESNALDLISSLAIVCTVFTIAEVSVYINHKAKATLFLKIKMSES